LREEVVDEIPGTNAEEIESKLDKPSDSAYKFTEHTYAQDIDSRDPMNIIESNGQMEKSSVGFQSVKDGNKQMMVNERRKLSQTQANFVKIQDNKFNEKPESRSGITSKARRKKKSKGSSPKRPQIITSQGSINP